MKNFNEKHLFLLFGILIAMIMIGIAFLQRGIESGRAIDALNFQRSNNDPMKKTAKKYDNFGERCQKDDDCFCNGRLGESDSCGKPGQIIKCQNDICSLVFEEVE